MSVTTALAYSDCPTQSLLIPPLNGPSPSVNGIPISGISLIRGNHVARAMASMISGVTRIKKTTAIKILVQSPGRLAKATPDSPPSSTAITVAPNAAMKEFRIESPIPTKSNISRYQSVETPFTMTAKINEPGPNQLKVRTDRADRAVNTLRATSATTTMTTKRAMTAHATDPANSSSHHLNVVDPAQIVKELPLLNECRTTNTIGINKNNNTKTVQIANINCNNSKRPICTVRET